VLRDTQRICNASARSLVRNMAYASGPTVEMDVSRLEEPDGSDEIRPYKIYRTTNDGLTSNSAPVIRYNLAPSVANELMAVLDKFSRQADDVSGIPAYVLGSPQVAGAGRTLGGLSMLMGNAAKGVKQVISNVDRHVTEPFVREFYVLEMLFGDDEGIKSDAKVIAKGSAGILQREITQAHAVEMLTALLPYVQNGDVDRSAVKVLLRAAFKSYADVVDIDSIIPDPNRGEDVMAALRAAGIQDLPGLGPQGPQQQQQQASQPQAPRLPQGFPSLSPSLPARPGTPVPRLDRRSIPPPSPDMFERVAA
jgi:hypothetical protein